MRAVATSSMSRLRSSRVEGSIQCRSSTMNSSRLTRGLRQDDRPKSLEGLLALPLRTHRDVWVARGERQRQERGQERDDVRLGKLRERSRELIQLLRGGVLALELQHALKQLQHRMERAVLIIGRAFALELGVGLASHLRFHLLHQARFADARLATEHHHLPHPLPDLRPALQQQPHLLLPGHQRRQRRGVVLLFEHPVQLDRRRRASGAWASSAWH